MHNLINNLKNNNQDFEYYPTTDEILNAIYESGLGKSILDIGCGEGKAYTYFNEKLKNDPARLRYLDYYGIEKSKILIDRLPKEIILLGTDFYNTTLIDKKVDTIFCNPPYSEYAEWTCKIIKEANCGYAYLVIPERWQENDSINFQIKRRGIKVQNLGNFDFLDGERQARAKVNLLKVDFHTKERKCYSGEIEYNEYNIADPFEIWFEETFKITLIDNKLDNHHKWEIEKQQRDEREAKINNDIVNGKNVIDTLIEFYNNEMQNLMIQYKNICALDFTLLIEFNVNVAGVAEALKLKITNLKILYWKELFDKLDILTSKLCSRQKDALLCKLKSNVNIDFTEENIYSIVVWACKNANQYFSEQILHLFDDLSGDAAAIKLYKSNQKIFNQDDYRYKKPDFTHYTLDYRIIVSMSTNVKYAFALLQDIAVVAKNLGFETHSFYVPRRFSQAIILKNHNKLNTPLVEYKYFQNGNLHLRFNMDFLKAFNIEVARLNKWIHTKEDILKNFDMDITVEEINKYFNSNLLINGNTVLQLESNL